MVLGICDDQYEFTLVGIGEQSDRGIFSRSALGKKFEEDPMWVPKPALVNGSQDTVLPFVLVEDQAFVLSSYLQRPYPESNSMTIEKKIYNYRCSRARQVIENTFGIWSERWRILCKPIVAKKKTIEDVTKATICLHNFLMQKNDRNLYFDNSLVDRESRNGVNTTGSSQNQPLKHTFVFNNIQIESLSVLGKRYEKQFTEFFAHDGAAALTI